MAKWSEDLAGVRVICTTQNFQVDKAVMNLLRVFMETLIEIEKKTIKFRFFKPKL